MQILLADDHGLVREALTAYLSKPGSDISVIPAASLDEAIEVVADRAEDVDLAVLDLRMPGMAGVDGIDRFRQACPDVPVAILSGLASEEDVRSCLDKGAVGFFPKTLSGPSLVNAIKLVLSGEKFVPYDVSGLALPEELRDAIGGGATEPSAEAKAINLSRREGAVLGFLLKGQSNKEIARELDLQEVTIKLHMRSICRKLDVKNRTQAALRARELGLHLLLSQAPQA